jgi:hypothetical protein
MALEVTVCGLPLVGPAFEVNKVTIRLDGGNLVFTCKKRDPVELKFSAPALRKNPTVSSDSEFRLPVNGSTRFALTIKKHAVVVTLPSKKPESET